MSDPSSAASNPTEHPLPELKLFKVRDIVNPYADGIPELYADSKVCDEESVHAALDALKERFNVIKKKLDRLLDSNDCPQDITEIVESLVVIKESVSEMEAAYGKR